MILLCRLIFDNGSLGYSFWSHPIEATFTDVKRVSPLGLKPGSLEYHSSALTTLRRHTMKNMVLQSNVLNNTYTCTSIPYTPLLRYFLILINILINMKAANKVRYELIFCIHYSVTDLFLCITLCINRKS